MFTFLLIAYLVLFGALAFKHLPWAALIVIFALPSYLVRFSLGPIPMTLLEAMILITVVMWYFRRRCAWQKESGIRNQESGTEQPLIHNSLFLIPSSLFLLAATFSMFVAPDLRAAAGIWKAYFVEPIMFFLVLRDLLRGRLSMRSIIAALSLSALVLSIYAIYQRFTGFGIPAPWFAERRVTSIFPYPNALGLFLGPLVPLFVAMFFESVKISKRAFFYDRKKMREFLPCIYWLVATILSVRAIIFAKSTGALVGIAAGLFVMGLLILRNKVSNKKFYILHSTFYILVIAVIVGAILKIPVVKNEIFLKDWSGQVRRSQWTETTSMLKDHPMLGAGLSGYKEALAPYHKAIYLEIFEYPHNIALNFWSETGLLGLIAFTWLAIHFFRQVFKKFYILHSTFYILGLATAMTTLLIHGLVDVPYFKNDLAMLFWILYSLGLMSD